MKLMNIKLNMVNLLLILLVVIALSCCVSNIVEGMSNSDHKKCMKGCEENDKSDNYMCSNYSGDDDQKGYCKYDSDCSDCNNHDTKSKKENKLVDDMLKKESEISDDLKIYSDLLGHSGSGHHHNDNKHHNDKKHHKKDKKHDRGDGNWDDYWGMGVGDTRSYDNYHKRKDEPSSIHVTHNGKQILATPQNTINGIPGSQIPAGQKDLYVLKSEVVPPVCPACPNVVVDKALLNKKCEPCPPCARCPEPAFDCKKVPNYSLGQANSYLPRPILNDFSTFGA